MFYLKKTGNSRLAEILFGLLLLVIAFLYSYQDIVFYRPQSTHQWRQGDCASIVMNYYQGGMNFFKPEVHNLTAKEGTSGIAFTSEIPLYYYGVAGLYKIFGPHEYIFRILNTLIFLLGLFFLQKLFYVIVKSRFWSFVLSLFFFTSPVLVYYGNNYITNPLALSFSIIGLFYIAKFFIDKKIKFFILFIVFFFIAASLKLTAFISYIAIGTYVLFEFISGKWCAISKKRFENSLGILVLMGVPFALVALWVFYAHYQNTANQCYYFSTVTFPIWNLSGDEILKVLEKINKIWVNQYFHFSMLILFGLEFLFLVLNFRKLPLLLKVFLIVVFSEVVVFVLFQFWTFADHDYYTIGLYILPISVSLSAIFLLKKCYNKIYNSRILQIAFLFLLLFNVYYAKQQLNERYKGWWNPIDKYEDLHTIEPYLRDIGINQTDTVISIPDYSNVSLYLMNQKGWTEHVDRGFNNGVKIPFNADSIGIMHSINKGAKYLILNGVDQLFEKPFLKSFCYNRVGMYKGVMIFDLVAADTNFSIENKVVRYNLFCDAENLTLDGNYYIGDSVKFEYGKTQSDSIVFAGEKSCRLNAENPYGMTYKFMDIEVGDSFKVRVWCNNSYNGRGEIVAQYSGVNIVEDISIVEKKEDWSLLEANIFIRKKVKNPEMVLFLYNTSGNSYFDNYEIIRYETILN